MQDGISKIVQRLGGEAKESLITEIYRYLERSKRAGGDAKKDFKSKEEEARALIAFANEHKLWFDFNHFSVFLDEGAEQKVFLIQNCKK